MSLVFSSFSLESSTTSSSFLTDTSVFSFIFLLSSTVISDFIISSLTLIGVLSTKASEDSLTLVTVEGFLYFSIILSTEFMYLSS